MRIGVEQFLAGLSLDDQAQFPHQVVGILKTRIGSACAKRRHLVRRIAREQHPAMAKFGHAAALEGVDADPLQLKRPLIAQHGLQTWNDFFGLFFLFGVGVPAQLKINAPDVVALLVQQHALVGVKRRVKPKPALGRVIGLHDHIGDQKAVLKHTTLNVQPQVAANRTARPIGHHQPIGLDIQAAIRRFYRQRGVVGSGGDSGHFVLPADVCAQFQCPGDQHFLHVVLLQIDHAGALVSRIGHQVELVHLFLFQKSTANVPAHAHVAGLVGNAQSVQNFERTLGIANRARADRHGFVIVQHQHLQPLQAGINGGSQTHRACANDDQRLALRRFAHQVCGGFVGVNRVGVGTHVKSSQMVKNTFRCVRP